jgi:hypothetical protein
MPLFNINNNKGNKKAKTILYAEYTDRSGFQIHNINNVTDHNYLEWKILCSSNTVQIV